MGLHFEIAKRYLFGKKSTNAINLITGIAVFGISIGTAALILILSVFNGFEGLLSELFNAFNPDLLVVPKDGKSIKVDEQWLAETKQLGFVDAISLTIEEVSLFEYDNVQEIGMLKGVDHEYTKVTGFDTLLLSGNFKLNSGSIDYGLLGSGLRNKLGVSVHNSLTPLTVYSPTRKKSFGSTKDFTIRDIYPKGVFTVQSDNDYQYVITHLEAARKLFQKPNECSAYEIKLNDRLGPDEAKEALQANLPKTLKVQTRLDQDAAFIKIMRIEKWIAFLIVSLTMLLIAFNLVGCLWMIVLDKKGDIATLKALGFAKRDVFTVFVLEGMLITIIGMMVGVMLALCLYFLQSYFGLISVPEGFLIDAYPIRLHWFDFVVVLLTVISIGTIAAYLPAWRATKFGSIIRADI